MAMKAVFFNPTDNTAVAIADLPKGAEVDVRAGDVTHRVKLVEPIAYQHKFSVTPIRRGEAVRKYGQVIGEATHDIEVGAHVHIHNMVGLRLKAASKLQ